MEFAIYQLLVFGFLITFDTGSSIYSRYFVDVDNQVCNKLIVMLCTFSKINICNETECNIFFRLGILHIWLVLFLAYLLECICYAILMFARGRKNCVGFVL